MQTVTPAQSVGPPQQPADGDGDPAARWNPWSAPAALVIAAAAALVLAAAIGAVAAIAGQPVSKATAAENIVSTFGQDLCFVGAALWLAGRVAVPRPSQFGLRPTAIGRAVTLVIGGYLLFTLITVVWALALNLHQTDKLPQKLGADESTLALAAVGVLTCVVAPICEEFLFRGYMFRALRNWRGVWPAAILTGLAFGAVHVVSAPAGYLLPLATFGVILCFVYQFSGSLYPGIALHCLNNSLAFAALEHARDGAYAPLVIGSLATIGVVLAAAVRWWPAGDRRPAPQSQST